MKEKSVEVLFSACQALSLRQYIRENMRVLCKYIEQNTEHTHHQHIELAHVCSLNNINASHAIQ